MDPCGKRGSAPLYCDQVADFAEPLDYGPTTSVIFFLIRWHRLAKAGWNLYHSAVGWTLLSRRLSGVLQSAAA